MAADRRSLSLLLMLTAFLPLAPVSPGADGERRNNRRPVTVADAIRMSRLATPDYTNGAEVSSKDLAAQFSPDGRKFVVILRKGNLEKNTNEYTMLLWRTRDIVGSPASERLLTLSSSSNREAIEDVTWLKDNETVAFLGEHPGELRQLYVFNTRTRMLTRLTNERTNVLFYSMSAKSDIAAYTVAKVENFFDGRSRRRGLVVSGQHLSDLINSQEANSGEYDYGDFQLFVKSAAGTARPIAISPAITSSYKPFLSPDGKYLVMRAKVPTFPDIWGQYLDAALLEQVGWVSRYVLINATTGASRILLDSPIRALATLVAWSPDSHSVAIGGVYLPLDNTEGDERKTRRSKTFVVEIDISSGKMIKIGQEDSLVPGVAWYDRKTLSWDSRRECLLYQAVTLKAEPDSTSKVVFKRVNGQWERISTMPEDTRPQILVEEDMQTPPRLYAVESATHRKRLLLDLNPNFKDLEFAKVEEIHWNRSGGQEARGGLYYPVDYVQGRRYPLVIQTHNWTAEKFWIDGPYTTAFAAQPLAGRGIMVLQVGEIYVDMPDEKEMDAELSTYESVIEYLDGKGLIDRNRVGLIGFSRSCLSVKYALVHSRYRFAAASVTDGLDGGYVQFIERFNSGRYFIDFSESLNGGLPYGPGMKTWLIKSPGFNLDKVRAPVRIVALHPGSVLGEWEWFAGLSILNKPVEMTVIEDGTHVLQKPRDRVISQQGSVDWFTFWLKGEEDPDPDKAEQYRRWHELRKLQEANEVVKQSN